MGIVSLWTVEKDIPVPCLDQAITSYVTFETLPNDAVITDGWYKRNDAICSWGPFCLATLRYFHPSDLSLNFRECSWPTYPIRWIWVLLGGVNFTVDILGNLKSKIRIIFPFFVLFLLLFLISVFQKIIIRFFYISQVFVLKYGICD